MGSAHVGIDSEECSFVHESVTERQKQHSSILCNLWWCFHLMERRTNTGNVGDAGSPESLLLVVSLSLDPQVCAPLAAGNEPASGASPQHCAVVPWSRGSYRPQSWMRPPHPLLPPGLQTQFMNPCCCVQMDRRSEKECFLSL